MQKIYIWIILLFCVLLESCTDSDAISDDTHMAVLKVLVGSIESQNVLTKSTFSETGIYNLHVLVYNSSGELIGHGYSSTGNSVTLTTRVGTGNTVYAVANTYSPSLFDGSVAVTESQLKEFLSSTSSLDGIKTGDSSTSALVMAGSKSGVIISSSGTTISSGQFLVTRLAAKITLNITGNNDIKITGYAIKNIPGKSYIATRPNTNESLITDIAVGDDAVTTSGDWFDVGTTSLASLSTYSTSFYMYENRRGGRITVDSSTGTLTNQQEKSKYAPSNATYVEIYAQGTNFTATYKVYLGGDNSQNYNVKRNFDYTYTINLYSANSIDTRVTKIENLSSKQANCYMVAPRQSIIIDVNTKGNGSTTNNQGITTTHSAASVAILWQTVSNLINISSLSSGKVTITAGTETGNAVIAAYSGANGTGTILWSWHIWVTAYELGTSGTSASNGSVLYYNASTTSGYMMDRNLAAYSATEAGELATDVFYQWGRKDPFPRDITLYGKISSISKVYGAVSISTTIAAPSVFNYEYNSPNNWNSSPNNNLWGNGAAKTIFDPCPYGWKVPADGIYSYFLTSGTTPRVSGSYSNGFNFIYSGSSTTWYPASGFRSQANGDFGASGTMGFCWSSSSLNDTFSAALQFDSSNIYPSCSHARGHAFAVRCIRE